MKPKFLIYSLLLCALIAFFGIGEFLVGEAMAEGKFKTITIDGKKNDWNHQPVLSKARNNKLSYFPAEVGAAIADRVDIRHVKAVIDAKKDVFYFYIRFWGGPAWPNYAYVEEDTTQTTWVRHRGYYHLMLDLDNDPSTGWNNHWYEGHLTPLGYYASQGVHHTDPVGVECVIDLELDSWWMLPDWTGEVNYVGYGGADYREYNGEVGPDSIAEFSWFYVENAMVKDMTQYVGKTIDDYDGEEHWAGHAFGNKFLEYGVSLDAFRAYWEGQGLDYIKPGDKIGIAGFVETSIDDWGVDVSPRGCLRVPGKKQCEKDKYHKTIAGINEVSLPTEFKLNGNYPNPFNPETEIRFQLPEDSHVIIRIYNALGQEITKLSDTQYPAGYHSVSWNGTDHNGWYVSSGIYVYTIQAGKFQDVKKMILLK